MSRKLREHLMRSGMLMFNQSADGGDGGGGDGGDGGDAAAKAAAAAAAPKPSDLAAAVAQHQAAKPAEDAAKWDGKLESLPPEAQEYVKQLRSENAERRTKLSAAEQQQAATIKALAKAAGLEVPGDEGDQPDPTELTKELEASRTERRLAKVELAVYKAAAKAEGDPQALLDSRSFLEKVAELDPAEAEFQSKIDTAIADAVKENPKLKAVQATTQSTIDLAGGAGEGKHQPRSLEAAVKAAYQQ